MCERNGRTSAHGPFRYYFQTVNVVGSNTQNNTTATINLYGATPTIGSQDAQEICSGGNSSGVNFGPLIINSKNCTLPSTGHLQLTGLVVATHLNVSLPTISPIPSHTPTIRNLLYDSATAAYIHSIDQCGRVG